MSEALTILHPSQFQASFSADLFASFIDYTSVKDTTLKGYITCIKAFSCWLVENGITQPTRADIKTYEKHLAGSGYKPGTQAQYLRAVKHFFKWTAAEGLYPNIADNIKGAKIRRNHHNKDAVSRKAINTIAEAIDRRTEQGKRLYALCLLSAIDGLRTVEISRANIEDIKIIDDNPFLYVQGKGHDEKDAPLYLTDEIKAALDEYIASRTDKPTGKSPLFASTSNRSKGKRIAPTTISTMLKKTLLNAGYDSNTLTAHSFRHASGTGARKAGLGLYEIQHLMRHCDPATSEIYIHDDDNLTAEIAGRKAIYNYYFRPEAATDAAQEAIDIINGLSPDKLEKALIVLRAIL